MAELRSVRKPLVAAEGTEAFVLSLLLEAGVLAVSFNIPSAAKVLNSGAFQAESIALEPIVAAEGMTTPPQKA